MIGEKKVLAIVPARGGSKGIPLKNIYPFRGLPLISWVGRVATSTRYIDRTVVSTDHPEIAKVARQAGLEVPFMRPKELSGDQVGDLEVLRHAVLEVEEGGGDRFDLIVMLQPTCPLRKPGHVDEAIKMLIDQDLDAVWSVSRTDFKHHPLKQLRVEEGLARFYDEAGRDIVARQQLEPLYHKDGAVYVFTRECIFDQQTIYGEKTGAFVTEGPIVNIDTLSDIRFGEFLISEEEERFRLS